MKTFLLSIFALFTFPFSAYKEGNLKEIIKPYLGEYECRSATLGDINLAERFDDIVLNLGENGVFTLTIKEKTGKKRVETGKYSYDDKKHTICFYDENNRVFKREYTLLEGKFSIVFPLGNKTARLTFEQK